MRSLWVRKGYKFGNLDVNDMLSSLQCKVAWGTLKENFDTSTAIGRSVIRVVLVFAQLEREQTSERTIDVMAHRQGLFNGGYPRIGYDIDYENKCSCRTRN